MNANESGTPQFSNKRFLSELGRTDAGSLRINIRSATPGGRYDDHRQLAACIYDLAAELERRSGDLGARWAVSPQAFNSRIDVELVEGNDIDAATRFVTGTLADLGLA